MIKFIKGASIKDASSLYEGYRKSRKYTYAVLNVDNIIKVMKSFIKYYENHNCFIFIEVPCNLDEEKEYGDDKNLHIKVYYLDNIWADEALKLLELFEEILVNDGFVNFGVGNHEGEIGKYRYNTIGLYTENENLIEHIFDMNGIRENKTLITPEELINENNPGEITRYEDAKGRTIYDVIETLTEVGLYLDEIKVED